MAERAFEGTVLEGRERRYTIINERDLKKYVKPQQLEQLNEILDAVQEAIENGRELEGKDPYNSYIVINADEPYVNEVIEVMKRYGHFRAEGE